MHGTRAGWHLLYDGIVTPSSAKKLGDPKALDKFLRKLVKALDAEMLQDPLFHEVTRDPAKGAAEEGLAAGCLTTMGHLSLHTWPSQRKFCLDIFLCKKFNRIQSEEVISDTLGVSQKWIRWIERSWPA